MKKLLTISIIVVLIAAMILTLLLNKRATQSKTVLASRMTNAVSVRIGVVSDTAYNLSFTSNGVLEPIRELTFVSDVTGRVVSLQADEGSRVTKGSILLKVDDALLRADLEASEAAYRALKTDYERFSNVVDKGGVSTQQLDNIRTQLTAAHSRYLVSKRRFEDALVRAPISGIINDRYVEVGTYLNPGARLFDIMDETSLKLTVNVTERQVLQLKKGMAVRIGCRTFPGEIETGFISFIGQKADRSLSFPVEITLREKDKLKAGMFTTAYFDFPSSTKGVLIPRNAINGSIQQANVFLVRNGLAEKRPVVVGDIVGRDVEVLSGLQPGDSIVTAGLINVTAGIRVQNKQ